MLIRVEVSIYVDIPDEEMKDVNLKDIYVNLNDVEIKRIAPISGKGIAFTGKKLKGKIYDWATGTVEELSADAE